MITTYITRFIYVVRRNEGSGMRYERIGRIPIYLCGDKKQATNAIKSTKTEHLEQN